MAQQRRRTGHASLRVGFGPGGVPAPIARRVLADASSPAPTTKMAEGTPLAHRARKHGAAGDSAPRLAAPPPLQLLQKTCRSRSCAPRQSAQEKKSKEGGEERRGEERRGQGRTKACHPTLGLDIAKVIPCPQRKNKKGKLKRKEKRTRNSVTSGRGKEQGGKKGQQKHKKRTCWKNK